MEIRDTFITFAGQVQKTKKDVKVKSFVRNGKVVRAFDRNQEVNVKNDKGELAKKAAIGSLATLGGLLGVGLAGAAVVKLKYNGNLIKLGKQLKDGKNTIKMRNDIRDYKAPTVIGDNKESLNFIFPGLPRDTQAALQESATTGGILKRGLKEANKKEFSKMEFINTGYTEMISEVKENGVGTMVADISNFAKKAAIKGESKDAIAIAQEIFDWHKLNPTKSINLFTHSAGGMIARDTSHILVNAGIPAKQIKMLATGSPNYGLVDDIVDTKYLMHVDDAFGQISTKTSNTQWIRSPANELDKIVDKAEKDRMTQNKINYIFGIHNIGMYWGKASVNGTARSTQKAANEFLFGKR